jgi:phosphoribosylformylglycinamidine cyclo-ligase
MTKITYQQSGVDPEKAGKILSDFSSYQKSRPRDPRLISGIGPFASCYSLKDLIQGQSDPILVTCCDGVGTKLKLALDWEALDGLGFDLVAMNVNDLLCTGARPLLFLDYYACGKLEASQLSRLLQSIQRACESAGCSLAGGETAEMPGLYHDNDFDLAGFSVGLADRSELLGAERVRAGDCLVALESSGFHSNGYSLVRKIVEREKLQANQIAPFSKKTWKELLLAPTHIYVSALKNSLPKLHALAHLTGGGLFENLPRVLPSGHRAVIQSTKWAMPPLFTWFQEKAGLSTEQVLSTFNCGVGMIAICDPSEKTALIENLKTSGIRGWEVGNIEKDNTLNTPQVTWQ